MAAMKPDLRQMSTNVQAKRKTLGHPPAAERFTLRTFEHSHLISAMPNSIDSFSR